MQNDLTGLGLFTRAPSERVPHATSVAIDLGLLATAPQAERPWACKVTVSLLKPGPDGLAHDMVDVERLTMLGQEVIHRLGRAAVFVAAITGDGQRSWLFYTGGADAPTVMANVRYATRLACAEQADYVPHVTVDSDPSWAVYKSLYPTASEARDIVAQRAETKAIAAAKLATRAAVTAMQPITGPATVQYKVTFPTSGARAVFLQRAVSTPFRAEPSQGPQPAGAGEEYRVSLLRDGPVDVDTIHKSERWLIHEAIRVGGRYDGWAMPAASPAPARAAA